MAPANHNRRLNSDDSREQGIPLRVAVGSQQSGVSTSKRITFRVLEIDGRNPLPIDSAHAYERRHPIAVQLQRDSYAALVALVVLPALLLAQTSSTPSIDLAQKFQERCAACHGDGLALGAQTKAPALSEMRSRAIPARSVMRMLDARGGIM